MKSRLAILLVVVITITALLVAGCAPKAEPAPAPTTAPTTAPTAAPTAAPAPTPAPEQEVFKWRAQTLWDAGENVYKDFADWCARVGEVSGGRLTIEPFPAGAIVSYNEAFEAVRSGMFEIDGSSGYAAGKDPAFQVATTPAMLYENYVQRMIWYDRAGGRELIEELYRKWGCHCLGIHSWGDESLIFTKEVSEIEDFKGLKMRAPEDQAAVFAALGADVRTIPGPDVYLALSTGVIDAADWGSVSMNKSKGFFEVANYYSYPGYHSSGFSTFYINGDVYDALPQDLQSILDSTAVEYGLNQEMTATYGDRIAVAELKKMGVYGISGSPELVKRIRELHLEGFIKAAEGNDIGTRLLDSHLNFLKEIGLID